VEKILFLKEKASSGSSLHLKVTIFGTSIPNFLHSFNYPREKWGKPGVLAWHPSCLKPIGKGG
jgi:hypothetical protein